MSDKGFSLVELAFVMVIIGILIAAISRGTGIIENARGKKVVSDAAVLINAQNKYFERQQRYAGDSDNDGVINFQTLNSAAPDNTNGTTVTDVDFAFEELKSLNLLTPGSNTPLSTTQSGGYMYFAGALLGTGNITPVNMIVLRNVECIAAFALELNIDNTSPDSSGSAASGRIRMITGTDVETGTTSWTTTEKGCVVDGAVSNTARVNVAYIFSGI